MWNRKTRFECNDFKSLPAGAASTSPSSWPLPIVYMSRMEKPSCWIVMCLIICLDGTGGEGFSYCFNRSWRNNQVTPSHSTDFFANGDKGTGAEGREDGLRNACMGSLSLTRQGSRTDFYLFLKHVRLTIQSVIHMNYYLMHAFIFFRIYNYIYTNHFLTFVINALTFGGSSFSAWALSIFRKAANG